MKNRHFFGNEIYHFDIEKIIDNKIVDYGYDLDDENYGNFIKSLVCDIDEKFIIIEKIPKCNSNIFWRFSILLWWILIGVIFIIRPVKWLFSGNGYMNKRFGAFMIKWGQKIGVMN